MSFHKKSLMFIFFILHILSWIRSDPVRNKEIANLFQNTSSVKVRNATLLPVVAFAEGGVVIPDVAVNGSVPQKPNENLEDKEESLAVGAQVTGTSAIKARKGVVEPTTATVARKGAEPPAKIQARKGVVDINETRTTIPVYESSESSPSASTSLSLNTTNHTSVTEPSHTINVSATTTNATIAVKHKKPRVTMVVVLSDDFSNSAKADKNVVIPVVALVMAPLIVLLALFIYKRYEERSGDSYSRMGFLIEDIYND